MDDAAAALASAIGSRVKLERTNRGWTLDQLAAAADLSRRMLVNVEQGAVNPSVGTLLRLSDALGVGLPALVEPPERRATKVVRHGEGAVLWTSSSGGRGVLLAGTEPPEVVELWDWTLAAGDRHESEPHTPGTRELLHVQHGRLTVEVDGERFDLDSGDALSFHSDVAHAYTNQTRTTTRFTLSVFEPNVGTARRTETPDA
ncbi:helix-turn-helix domain-containing protein [Agromyces sp. NPDC058110]|uniref:helix-turn-helix domain-containing protein n=1 Tax=Agromyces sp. NPDC058110 TaxID=3346345 RepID=UPI0036D83AED